MDAVVDAFLGSSLDARRHLVRFLTTPCTTARGLGGPPKCEAGEAEGTPVEVFPVAMMEGYFVRRESIDGALQFEVVGLYGVFRAPGPTYERAYWPAGEYAVTFAGWTRPPSTNIGIMQTIVFVQDGTVVRLTHTPFVALWPPTQSLGTEWVLPPLK